MLQVLKALPYTSVTLHATITPGKIAQRLPRASDLPSWAKATLSRLAQGQSSNQQDTVDALAALLAAQAPIVLHVEDLHEAEGEALALWVALSKAVRRSSGVGLIVTSRQEPPDAFTVQQSPPLTLEESWELLEEEAGASLPADAVAWIHEFAAGNPLFTLEFFRFLRRHGNLWRDGRRWRWRAPEALRIPSSVEVLIVQAIHRAELSEEAVTLMRLKALLPLGTSDEVLAQVMRVTEAELSRLSAQLEAAGILREGGFVHPLYRELLIRELQRDERGRLAGQIVEAFATTEPEMAAPYVADAGFRGEVALDILERAATEAERHGRERQAGEFLSSAATYASGERKRDLLLRAARLLHVLHPFQAQRLTERVLEVEPHHVEAGLLLARSLVRQGEGERA
ncbi:MAG: hypothetical protein M3511_01940, partial [Deinococcota bacterium]|nr:hypothetical protein [Deinococcota bacterium]